MINHDPADALKSAIQDAMTQQPEDGRMAGLNLGSVKTALDRIDGVVQRMKPVIHMFTPEQYRDLVTAFVNLIREGNLAVGGDDPTDTTTIMDGRKYQ